MFSLSGGLFLGWALGANDAANVFGTAVASRIITFRKASILCAVAIIIGAICQGEGGIHTLSGLSKQTHMTTLLVVSLSAAVTVTLMTIMRLPISASQATVGSIAGVGLATGTMQWGGLIKVTTCWVASPIGALIIAVIIYKLLAAFIRYAPISILTRDKILWSGLIIVGIYGSYALGANSSANATGIFSGQFPGISDRQLALLGGISIALGVLTYSKRVMMAVGKGIMPLDAFTALVTVSSMATTIHIFAFIGVPVSTSQATIGAIMGIGLVRGVNSIKFRSLRNIGFGWLLTPIIALILSSSGYAIFCLAKPAL